MDLQINLNGKESLSAFTYAAAYADGTPAYGSAAGSPSATRFLSVTPYGASGTSVSSSLGKGITGRLQTSKSGAESTESTAAYTGFAAAKNLLDHLNLLCWSWWCRDKSVKNTSTWEATDDPRSPASSTLLGSRPVETINRALVESLYETKKRSIRAVDIRSYHKNEALDKSSIPLPEGPLIPSSTFESILPSLPLNPLSLYLLQARVSYSN